MKGLAKTKAQNRVLDEIGCGNYSPIAHPKIIAELLNVGLIKPLPDKIFGTGLFASRMKQYHMPVHVHYAWCQSCADEGIPDDR